MKLVYKEVALKSIVVDAPDIRRRTQLPHVAELAADIELHGGEPIHAPVIRKGTNAIICGRDRFAALLRNKAKRVWVHVAECTDQEARELELAENIYRRADNRTELLAQLVALKKPEIRAKLAKQSGDNVPASEQTITAAARKEVARSAGVQPSTVKRAEQRAAAKRERHDDSAPAGHGAQGEPATAVASSARETPGGDGNPAPEAVELPPSFETFGIEVDRADRVAVRNAIVTVAEWDRTAIRLLTELTNFEKKQQTSAVIAPAHIQRIREGLKQLGHAIRDAVPVKLCVYCKNRPDLRPNCHACGQSGFMGRNDGENAPAELKAKGAAASVAAGGKFVPYGGATVITTPPVKLAGKGQRVVRVEDAEGRELTFVPDDEEPAFT